MSSATEQTRTKRRVRHAAIRAEVAQEEAETAEEEAAALDVPSHLRIDADLDAQLRARAADQHIPTSALVRRLHRWGVVPVPEGGW